MESWRYIPDSVADDLDRRRAADEWAAEQRRQLAEQWAASQRALWQPGPSDVQGPGDVVQPQEQIPGAEGLRQGLDWLGQRAGDALQAMRRPQFGPDLRAEVEQATNIDRPFDWANQNIAKPGLETVARGGQRIGMVMRNEDWEAAPSSGGMSREELARAWDERNIEIPVVKGLMEAASDVRNVAPGGLLANTGLKVVREGVPLAEAAAGLAKYTPGMTAAERAGAAKKAAKGAAGQAAQQGVQAAGQQQGQPSPLGQLAQETLARAKGTAGQAAELRPPEEGFAGNVNLAKGRAENAGIAQEAVDANNQFAGQRRGVVSDVSLEEGAQRVASERSVEDWLTIKPGQALNAEEATALRSTTEKVGNEFRAMQAESTAKRAVGQLTPVDEARLAEKGLEYAAMLAVRSGAAAEAGRALRSFKLLMGGEWGSNEKAIQLALKEMGRGKDFDEWVARFSMIDPRDVAAQRKMLRELYKPGFYEKLNAWRYASMLSSWKTHGANITSTIAESLNRPLDLALAGYGREAAADVKGMAGSLGDASRAFWTALESGQSRFGDTGVIEHIRPRPFGEGKLGRAVTLPSDLLMAEDDALKAMNFAGAAHAAAYRLARGDAAKAKKMLANITEHPELMKAAQDAARYATFTNDPNELVKRVMAVANTPGPTGAAVKVILPFIRTPANIYIRGLDMMLRPMITGPARMALAAARRDPRALRLEAARTVKSGAIIVGLYGMAMNGQLTGQGPSDPAKRRILEEAGWQANSINVGGRWVAYNNFGPISIPMAAVAAVKEGLDEGQKPNTDMLVKVADRVYESMLDTSFVQGLSDFFRGEGISGKAANIGASFLGSLVPYGAAGAAIERIADPTVRAKDNPLSAVQGRIPAASQALPAEPSIYGGTRQQGQGDLLGQILLPWRTQVPGGDPVAREVARINQSPEARQAGAAVSVRQFGDTYAGAKQTPEQRRTLQGEAGQMAAAYIADTISRPEYQSLTDAQKAATLNRMIGTAYELADLQLGDQLARDPRHTALLAWAAVPQYEGVKGSEEQIRQQNFETAQAKAKLAEYRAKYGEDMGEYRLMKEDKAAYKLAQRARLDSDYLNLKRKKIDQRFGGALTQAEREGLVGAGNTVLPVGGAR